MDWVVIAVILLSGAAASGIGYLLSQYRYCYGLLSY